MNKKVKFNLLDFAIILLAIFSILAVIFWDDIRAKFIYDEDEIEYSFTIENVTEEMLSFFSENLEMKFQSDSANAGVITSFKYEKETSDIISDDGKRYTYENDLYRIDGTAKVSGREKENGFYISGKYFVVPGKIFDVETKELDFKIKITYVRNG